MFIVVAIVIFGIFVVLANTVFGSEGLTNDLKGLFENAIEHATNSTEKSNGKGNLLSEDILLQHGEGSDGKSFTIHDSGMITIESEGVPYTGIRIDDKFLQPNTSYKMNFKMKVTDGIVKSIGGHMTYSDKTQVYIDGKLVSDTNLEENGYITSWYTGLLLDDSKDTHTVEVVFNTNGYDDVNAPSVNNAAKYKSMYIQPNRGSFGEPYSVEITDFGLYKQ